MRISDWSSDVCSSDLFSAFAENPRAQIQVEVYDGDGSFNKGCISWQTLADSRVVRSDCFVSTQMVFVEVKGLGGDDTDSSENTCKYMCELRLIFIALLLLLVVGVLSVLN